MNRRQACILLAATPAAAVDFESRLPRSAERPWIGPEYWANPLQDWRLRDGRIECFVSGGDRNVYLLTHEIPQQPGAFEMRVRLGRLEDTAEAVGEGFAGFRIGIRGRYNDYRDSAVYGIGLNAGISGDGRLFIGSLDENAARVTQPLENIDLLLAGKPVGTRYELRLAARVENGSVLAEIVRGDIPPDWLVGGVALVCSSGPVLSSPDPSSVVVTMSGLNKRNTARGGNMRFWFRDWKLSGDRVRVYPERAWGPILFAMHTVSRRTMKMAAQLPPLGRNPEPVRLQVPTRTGGWRTVQTSKIDPQARNATFRIMNWDDSRDTPYRLAFKLDGEHYFEGIVRKDPKDKPKIVVAALSCVNDLGFPHNEITRGVAHFQPDIIAFTGDQLYERAAGYGIERAPLETAILDYLRKWFLFGWSFRDLMAKTPSLCMPDDHDVYHGNVWGAGGRRAEPGSTQQEVQDSGGYAQPAQWVNMVQRTQTSHLPDPHDPTPVEQNIGVYYCSLNWGGVSFAIIEDRKWKSAPKTVLPNAKIVNGWAQNPAYSAPKDGDVPAAQQLGDRQIRFLNEWAADWTGGTWMKVLVSQTIFTNLATLPKPANTDAVTNKLPIIPVNGYSEGEVPVADHDSNGWPQTPRNEALRAIRRGLAFHIAGDQHLGSTVQYGIEDWNDASWAICVPAVSNLFPRRWYPPHPGRNPKPHSPRNTGEYLDGFGNKVTVHAIFNPQAVGIEPTELSHRAPGFGIIECDRNTRTITAANWPRWTDPSKPGAKPAAGWPITIAQTANGLSSRSWVLETGLNEHPGAIIQIVDQANDEVVYTYRPPAGDFVPTVFHEGTYTIRILDEAGKALRTIRNQRPSKSRT